jgi:hypothetical protein
MKCARLSTSGLIIHLFVTLVAAVSGQELSPITAHTYRGYMASFLRGLPKVNVAYGPTRAGITAAPNYGGPPFLGEHTWEQVTRVRPLERIMVFDFYDDVKVWPGQFVNAEELRARAVLSDFRFPISRGPARIYAVNATLNSKTKPSADLLQAEVANPNFQTINEAIHELISRDYLETSVPRVLMNLHDCTTVEEAFLKVSGSAGFLGQKLSAEFSAESFRQKNNFVVSLIQPYYSIHFEYPTNAHGFFGVNDIAQTAAKPMESQQEFENRIKTIMGDRSPVYISSVTYGRIMMLFISSEESKDTIKKMIEATFGFLGVSGNIKVETSETKKFSNSEVKLLVTGGSTEHSGTVLGKERLDAVKEFINQGGGFGPKSGGVPLWITLAHVNDGAPATITGGEVFDHRVSVPWPVSTIRVEFFTEDDGKASEVEVTVRVYRDDVLLAKQTVGKGEEWIDQSGPKIVELSLPAPSFDVYNIGKLSIVVEKNTNDGWHFTSRVSAVLGNAARTEVRLAEREDAFNKLEVDHTFMKRDIQL